MVSEALASPAAAPGFALQGAPKVDFFALF